MIDWLAQLDSIPNKDDRLVMDSQEIELMACVKGACEGLSMTPDQFVRVLNDAGKKQIVSGELSASRLRDYAKQVDSAISDGIVRSIMEKIKNE